MMKLNIGTTGNAADSDEQKLSDEEVLELFEENFFRLSEADIRELDEMTGDGSISNVMLGLNRECFGVLMPMVDDEVDRFQVFYINGDNKLDGFILRSSIHLDYRDTMTFRFAAKMSHFFEHLDSITVFNTLQQKFRSLLEKSGYRTITNIEMYAFEGQNAEIVVFAKGLIKVRFMDRLKIYRDIFGVKEIPTVFKPDTNYVYLMLDHNHGLVKIGKSKHPRFREKTLQGQQPKIDIITYWEAPAKVEKELHELYRLKKRRGEWFALRLKELDAIRKYMQPYPMLQ